MEEKQKKQLEQGTQFGSTEILDSPSPIRRHMKWKMTRRKKSGQMTHEAACEIADRIVS